jgi:hypothetical protein
VEHDRLVGVRYDRSDRPGEIVSAVAKHAQVQSRHVEVRTILGLLTRPALSVQYRYVKVPDRVLKKRRTSVSLDFFAVSQVDYAADSEDLASLVRIALGHPLQGIAAIQAAPAKFPATPASVSADIPEIEGCLEPDAAILRGPRGPFIDVQHNPVPRCVRQDIPASAWARPVGDPEGRSHLHTSRRDGTVYQVTPSRAGLM